MDEFIGLQAYFHLPLLLSNAISGLYSPLNPIKQASGPPIKCNKYLTQAKRKENRKGK
jgi:hypothetical protein